MSQFEKLKKLLMHWLPALRHRAPTLKLWRKRLKLWRHAVGEARAQVYY
jgi:hypothetical protein